MNTRPNAYRLPLGSHHSGEVARSVLEQLTFFVILYHNFVAQNVVVLIIQIKIKYIENWGKTDSEKTEAFFFVKV